TSRQAPSGAVYAGPRQVHFPRTPGCALNARTPTPRKSKPLACSIPRLSLLPFIRGEGGDEGLGFGSRGSWGEIALWRSCFSPHRPIPEPSITEQPDLTLLSLPRTLPAV